MARTVMSNDSKDRRSRVIRNALLLAFAALGIYAIYIALVFFGSANGAG